MTKIASVLWLLPLLAGCAGGEIVGLHIAVQPNGSATIIARALVESPTPSPVEVVGKGVVWGRRAALVYTQGTVAKLEDVQIGDDSLLIKPRMDANKVTVQIKRSTTAGWVKALVPDKTARRDLALVYDPLGKTKELGDTLRIELVLPGPVNSSSVLPTARGVEAGRENNRAYLTIPVETARENGDTLSWDITWN